MPRRDRRVSGWRRLVGQGETEEDCARVRGQSRGGRGWAWFLHGGHRREGDEHRGARDGAPIERTDTGGSAIVRSSPGIFWNKPHGVSQRDSGKDFAGYGRGSNRGGRMAVHAGAGTCRPDGSEATAVLLPIACWESIPDERP